MSNCSNNSITVETGKVNIPAVMPGLENLKGGKKQHWINANLNFISSTYERFGLEYTKAIFNLKDETLNKALQRSENKHRPAVTMAEKAFNSAFMANEKYYKLQPEVDEIISTMSAHISNDQQLRQTLSDFFQLQAKLNSMVSDLVLKQDYNMSNFTEHILWKESREVRPTRPELTLNGIKVIKDGPSSSVEVRDRLNVSNDTRPSAGNAGDGVIKAHPGNRPGIGNKMTGKGQTSRPAGRQRINSNRERYLNAKRRGFGRV